MCSDSCPSSARVRTSPALGPQRLPGPHPAQALQRGRTRRAESWPLPKPRPNAPLACRHSGPVRACVRLAAARGPAVERTQDAGADGRATPTCGRQTACWECQRKLRFALLRPRPRQPAGDPTDFAPWTRRSASSQLTTPPLPAQASPPWSVGDIGGQSRRNGATPIEWRGGPAPEENGVPVNRWHGSNRCLAIAPWCSELPTAKAHATAGAVASPRRP